MYDIRPATREDAAIIAVQRRRMFLDMGRPDDAKMQAMLTAFLPWVREAISEGHYLGMLAANVNQVAAGAGMLLLENPPGFNDQNTTRAYIFNVYTELEHRRLGLARTLVQALLEEAKLRGIRSISLHAASDGRALYQELGFQNSNEMRLLLEP
jgi:ribosomal protein S18 acetylase RimI-like enzyme